MLFNSFEFLAFFIVFLGLFFSSPLPLRPVVLLISSYLFYAGWRPSYVLLLIFTTLVDYFGALVIDRAKTLWVRRLALLSSLGINLGILATLKYADFAISSVIGTAGLFGAELPLYALNFVLPVGISFYTFQSVGYTLDVYFRRMRAEANLLYYAIYVAFFPQLVAGPIERASHMLAQYRTGTRLDPTRLTGGLWLIGYGLFKKMCVADLVSPFVNGVYADPSVYNGSYTFLATVLFALQIYCDFSGYSDIAIGVACIMGYDLMINFRQPYLSATLTQFWRAWHISLTTWFRDFVYVPLGGSRVSEARWIRNILVVFLVSGIWHGAAWTFVIWGVIHGIALAAEGLATRRTTALPTNGQSGTVPSAAVANRWGPLIVTAPVTVLVVLVGWVFFRARSLGDAVGVLISWTHPGRIDYGTFKLLGLSSFELLLALVHVVALFAIDYMIKFRADILARLRRSVVLSVGAAVVLTYDIILFGVFGRVDFIYFQF